VYGKLPKKLPQSIRYQVSLCLGDEVPQTRPDRRSGRQDDVEPADGGDGFRIEKQ